MSCDFSTFTSDQEAVPWIIQNHYKNSMCPWELLTLWTNICEENYMGENLAIGTGCSIASDVQFSGNVVIGDNVIIKAGTTIEGPVFIGNDVKIDTNAYIRPFTIIGDNCHVGHGSEVKRSILFGGSKISSLAFVGDSILYEQARVGSGVITANRNFSQGRICFSIENEKFELSEEFFGCVIGKHSRLGANATTQPGTVISPYCWVYPGTTVRGFVPEATRVLHEKPLVFKPNERHDLH